MVSQLAGRRGPIASTRVCALLIGLIGAAFSSSAWAEETQLEWEAPTQAYQAKKGEAHASFVFKVTNRAKETVTLFSAQPSCGCTVAEMPETPWPLAPGASGWITVVVDLTGKSGRIEQTIAVQSSAGHNTLSVRIAVPENTEAKALFRARNLQMAQADRQAVFRGSCADCHAREQPVMISDTYAGSCAICHESRQRASFVPGLAERGAGSDAAYWIKWIESGREGSLMPAFATEHGGNLTPIEIRDLASYLVERFRDKPASRP